MKRFTPNTLMLSPLALLFALLLPAAAQAEVYATGTWTEKSYAVQGTWTIVQEGNNYFVELDDNFRTRNAPDLKIFITPGNSWDLTDTNAIRRGVLISELESNRGAQRYRLPAAAVQALPDARSIMIHCERYSKLWASATIRRDG